MDSGKRRQRREKAIVGHERTASAPPASLEAREGNWKVENASDDVAAASAPHFTPRATRAIPPALWSAIFAPREVFHMFPVKSIATDGDIAAARSHNAEDGEQQELQQVGGQPQAQPSTRPRVCTDSPMKGLADVGDAVSDDAATRSEPDVVASCEVAEGSGCAEATAAESARAMEATEAPEVDSAARDATGSTGEQPCSVGVGAGEAEMEPGEPTPVSDVFRHYRHVNNMCPPRIAAFLKKLHAERGLKPMGEWKAPRAPSTLPGNLAVPERPPAKPARSLPQQVTAVLNKVSSNSSNEHYRDVRNELRMLPIPEADPATLDKVVDTFFLKAVSEPLFCKKYADLIVELVRLRPGERVAGDMSQSLEVRLRDAMVRKCMREFETPDAEAPKPDENGAGDSEGDSEKLERSGSVETEEERFIRECMLRDKRRGNAKFIAELFLRDIIAPDVIQRIILTLLCRQVVPKQALRSLPPTYVPAEIEVDQLIALLGVADEAFFRLPIGAALLPDLLNVVAHWEQHHPVVRSRLLLIGLRERLASFRRLSVQAQPGPAPSVEVGGAATRNKFADAQKSLESQQNAAQATGVANATAAIAGAPALGLPVSSQVAHSTAHGFAGGRGGGQHAPLQLPVPQQDLPREIGSPRDSSTPHSQSSIQSSSYLASQLPTSVSYGGAYQYGMPPFSPHSYPQQLQQPPRVGGTAMGQSPIPAPRSSTSRHPSMYQSAANSTLSSLSISDGNSTPPTTAAPVASGLGQRSTSPYTVVPMPYSGDHVVHTAAGGIMGHGQKQPYIPPQPQPQQQPQPQPYQRYTLPGDDGVSNAFPQHLVCPSGSNNASGVLPHTMPTAASAVAFSMDGRVRMPHGPINMVPGADQQPALSAACGVSVSVTTGSQTFAQRSVGPQDGPLSSSSSRLLLPHQQQQVVVAPPSMAVARVAPRRELVATLMAECGKGCCAREIAERMVFQFTDTREALSMWVVRCLTFIKGGPARAQSAEIFAAMTELSDSSLLESIRTLMIDMLLSEVNNGMHEEVRLFQFWAEVVSGDLSGAVFSDDFHNRALEQLLCARPQDASTIQRFIIDVEKVIHRLAVEAAGTRVATGVIVGAGAVSLVDGVGCSPRVPNDERRRFARFRPVHELYLFFLRRMLSVTGATGMPFTAANGATRFRKVDPGDILYYVNHSDVRQTSLEADVFCALLLGQPPRDILFEQLRTLKRIRDPATAPDVFSAILHAEMCVNSTSFLDTSIDLLHLVVDGPERALRETSLLAELYFTLKDTSIDQTQRFSCGTTITAKLLAAQLISDESVERSKRYFAPLDEFAHHYIGVQITGSNLPPPDTFLALQHGRHTGGNNNAGPLRRR